MTSIGAKARHVRQAKQSRGHVCHWPGCKRQVPPAMWGCSKHWFTLPAALRSKVWKCYRVGQEEDGRPSPDYVATAREVEAWALDYERQAKDRAAKNRGDLFE